MKCIKFSGIINTKELPNLSQKTRSGINYQEDKNLSFNGFCCASEPLSKNKRKQKVRQILGSCQKAEKAVEYEGESNTHCSLCPWNFSQKPVEKA